MADKTTKKKGPIRTEAVIPALVITGLVALYFILFFDGNLRSAIEWAATQGNGAEVNVGSLKTSLLKASLQIGDIQATDPQAPAKNRLQIGAIEFKLHWDALLRAKVVVDTAAIRDIEVGTARKRPGQVLPPPSEENSALAKLKGRVSRAVLSEAGALLEGLDPTQKIKDLGNLKSATRVRELQAELGKKEGEWGNALNSLPGEKDLASIQSRLNGIQPGGNPAEIAGKLAQLNELVKETEGKINAVKAQGDALVKDVNTFQGSIGQIDDLVKQDRQELEKQLKIPSLDAKSIAEQLFGNSILDKVGQAQRAMTMVRKYMPAKTAGGKAQKQVEENPKRARGRTYEFGHQNTYPKFWLRNAEISSRGAHSAFAGDIEGRLTDVASNPSLIGRPAVLALKGNFPQQQIGGVTLRLEIDHTREVAEERLKAAVAHFPVAERKISETEDLRFAIAKAVGKTGIDATLSGDRVHFAIDQVFENVDYQIAAKSPVLNSILQGVTKGVPTVQLNAALEGTWSDLGMSVQSNLASALQAGLEKQLQAKLAEARAKLDAMIQGNIAQGRAELNRRYQEQRTRLVAQVEDKRQKVEAVKAQALAKLTSVKSQANAVQQKANEGVEQLKKKFPFGR